MVIETICSASGCIVDYARADPAEIYYLTLIGAEVLIGTALGLFFSLKILWKYRKHFRYDD